MIRVSLFLFCWFLFCLCLYLQLTIQIEKRGLESQIKIMETAREEVKQEKVAIQEDVSDLQKKLQHSEMVSSIYVLI